MKTFSTAIALALAIGLIPASLGAERLPAVAADGSNLERSEAAGHLTALHFFPAGGQGAVAYAKALEPQAATLAGVGNAVVVPEKATGSALLFADQSGATAAKFGVSGTTPTSVLLDAKGAEVFRRSAEGGVPFDALAAQVRRASRAEALGEYNLDNAKVALKGYDPVAYFAGAPKKGNPGTRSEFRGAVYHFASEGNRAAFAKEPEKYLPTYGGWCATAMAKGDKVEIDPENFKVTDGRLFLFYKGVWGNAIEDWKKDEAGLAKKADGEWRKIAGE